MSNVDKAEQVILGRTATQAAQSLADAGLLMPDLPEPGKAWMDDDAPTIWRTENENDTLAVVLMKDHSLQVEDFNGLFMRVTPPAGRGLALALLAASNYAEEKNQ